MTPSRAFPLSVVCAIWVAAGCKKENPAPPTAASPAPARPAASVDAGATSEAGTSATEASRVAAADVDPSSLDPVTKRPLYYRRELRPEDVAGRSLRELSLMRNWIFARAGNAFRKPWLSSFFGGFDWYTPREKQDLSVLTEYDKKNAAKIAAAEAALSDDALRLRRDEVVARLRDDPGYPKAPAHPEDVIELSLIAARLGEWVEPKPGAETPSPLEDPEQLSRLLKLSDLQELSRRDLRILRNMIYARHGRPFQSAFLHGYFSEMEWYRPDESYTDARLTAIDKKNIQLIQSLENQVGGPLTDHEHLLEEYGGNFLGAA